MFGIGLLVLAVLTFAIALLSPSAMGASMQSSRTTSTRAAALPGEKLELRRVRVYVLTRRQANAYFERVANGTAGPPGSVSCRDLLELVDTGGHNPMLPYIGTSTLRTIRTETCAIFRADALFENCSDLSGSTVTSTNRVVRFHVQLDTTPPKELVDFTIAVADLVRMVDVTDGVHDFGGTSGFSIIDDPGFTAALLVVAEFDVVDEGYFRGAWAIDTTATKEPGNFPLITGGCYDWRPRNLAAQATVVFWNPRRRARRRRGGSDSDPMRIRTAAGRVPALQRHGAARSLRP